MLCDEIQYDTVLLDALLEMVLGCWFARHICVQLTKARACISAACNRLPGFLHAHAQAV